MHMFKRTTVLVLGVFTARLLVLLATAASTQQEDLLQRRETLWRALVVEHATATDMVTPGGQFAGEWLMGSLAMAAYAELNLAALGAIPEVEAATRVDALLARMLEPATRSFDTQRWSEDALTSLRGPHGHLGYLGHLALMLSGRLLLPVAAPAEHVVLQRAVVDALARRMDEAPAAQVETYPGETYPSDNVVLVAALAVDTRATGHNHAKTLKRYRTEIETLMDPHTGLLVFNVHDGRPAGPARGSSVGWNIFFWNQWGDPVARAQYQAWTRAMRVEPLPGLVASREHAHGVTLPGDVDSGPLVLGMSPSGTGFALAAARAMDDPVTFNGLLRTAEAAGTTVGWPLQRRYLLAPLVGDAIVLAMRTATPWPRPTSHPQPMRPPPA
jgi:hypothetical protein